MKKVFRVLRFLRVTDEQDNLSITNLAVYIVAYKLYASTATSLQDVALAFAAISNYAHKKHVSKGK